MVVTHDNCVLWLAGDKCHQVSHLSYSVKQQETLGSSVNLATDVQDYTRFKSKFKDMYLIAAKNYNLFK